jgi:outer membrane protein TolC
MMYNMILSRDQIPIFTASESAKSFLAALLEFVNLLRIVEFIEHSFRQPESQMDAFRKTFINLFLLCSVAFLFIFPSPLLAEPPSLNLETLIQEALDNNPAIMASQNNWKSAEQIIEARRSFSDPQFSYTYFIENVETRVGPQDHIFGIKQKFPFYGKRDLRAEVAAKGAENEGATHEAVKQEVIRRLKNNFYQLFYLSRVIGVTQKEKDLLRRMEDIALTRYEIGKGHQQNVLKVQVEITRLEEKLLALAALKKTTEEKLNKLLGRSSRHPLGCPEQPEFRILQVRKKELSRMALNNRPELKAARANIDKSKGNLSLAKKDYFPDLTVGFNYIQVDDGPLNVSDNGQDAYNVMFSINLPIWQNKLSSQVKSTTQAVAAKKSQYQDAMNQVFLEVEDYYFKIQTTSETFSLYEKVLIPQAEQSLKSAESGYETGKINFLDFLDAERTLLKIQYGYWKVFSDYLKHFADLERAVGTQLPE